MSLCARSAGARSSGLRELRSNRLELRPHLLRVVLGRFDGVFHLAQRALVQVPRWRLENRRQEFLNWLGKLDLQSLQIAFGRGGAARGGRIRHRERLELLDRTIVIVEPDLPLRQQLSKRVP